MWEVALLPDPGTDAWEKFVGEFAGQRVEWLLEVCRTADPLTARRALAALDDVHLWDLPADLRAHAEWTLRALVAEHRRLDPGLLLNVLEIYEQVAEEAAAPALLALFAHPEPRVIEQAIQVMDAVGANALAAAALDAVAPLTAHFDAGVRTAAVSLVAAMADWEGRPVPVPLSRLTSVLVGLVGGPDPELRAHAAGLLTGWDHDGLRADAALAPHLDAPDPRLRAAAVRRLARGGDAEAIARLLRELADPRVHPDFVTAAGAVARRMPRTVRRDLRKALKRLKADRWPALDPEHRRGRANRLSNALDDVGRW